MKVILGKRLYEKTKGGKYPKYNLRQMNRFVAMDCSAYTAIQVVCNVKSFDLFSKYQDELTKKEKEILDRRLKEDYGMINVNIDHLVDWEKFHYDKDRDWFEDKIKKGLK